MFLLLYVTLENFYKEIMVLGLTTDEVLIGRLYFLPFHVIRVNMYVLSEHAVLVVGYFWLIDDFLRSPCIVLEISEILL